MGAIDDLGLPPARWTDLGSDRVHYREWPGPGAGPTFVCVHGLGGSLLNWVPVAPGLARRGRVLALDLAGFGMTPPSSRGTGIAANWRLLSGFISALDLDPVFLVGNSMGGMLSLIQCAHEPERVEGMVLVDAAFPRARSPRAQPSPGIAALFAVYTMGRLGERFLTGRARRLGAEGLVRETLRVVAADPSSIDPTLVAALVEMARTRMEYDYASRAFLEAARSIVRSQVFPRRYRTLVTRARRPALVIHGAKDRLVPVAAAREAVVRHPGWKLVVFPDLGHIPQMEAPERWLAAVEAWLTEVTGPSGEIPGRLETKTG
jgi:pimeloyl-ACP methyl ester carboxylesterase